MCRQHGHEFVGDIHTQCLLVQKMKAQERDVGEDQAGHRVGVVITPRNPGPCHLLKYKSSMRSL